MIYEMINVEVRVISRAEGESDNSYQDIDNFAYHKKPNPIIALLYIVSLFPRAIDEFRLRKSLKSKMP